MRKMTQGEEQLVFGSMITLDIFLLSAILYLTSYVSSGVIIGKVWIGAVVITLTLVILMRIVSSFWAPKFFKFISYLSLMISIGGLLYGVYLLSFA